MILAELTSANYRPHRVGNDPDSCDNKIGDFLWYIIYRIWVGGHLMREHWRLNLAIVRPKIDEEVAKQIEGGELKRRENGGR